MYGKTYKLHNSQALASAEVLLVYSSPAFDRLHDNINFIIIHSVFLPEVIKEKAIVR